MSIRGKCATHARQLKSALLSFDHIAFLVNYWATSDTTVLVRLLFQFRSFDHSALTIFSSRVFLSRVILSSCVFSIPALPVNLIRPFGRYGLYYIPAEFGLTVAGSKSIAYKGVQPSRGGLYVNVHFCELQRRLRVLTRRLRSLSSTSLSLKPQKTVFMLRFPVPRFPFLRFIVPVQTRAQLISI